MSLKLSCPTFPTEMRDGDDEKNCFGEFVHGTELRAFYSGKQRVQRDHAIAFYLPAT